MNGELKAKRPQNDCVKNGSINFDGIIQGAEQRKKEQTAKFKEDMQKLTEKERKKAEELENLLLKIHEKNQEKRKKEMETEQKKAEQKANEEVREKYRAENKQAWNENKTDKAYKELLNNLKI